MSITLSQVQQLGGGVTRYRGAYSHTIGAAEETFVVGNGRVQHVQIANNDASGKLQLVKFTESVSGGTNTVTVNAVDAITSGRIEVEVFRGC